ncbi:MAG TPA: heme exporter protein CcmD [Hyphomonadaceae bacterium]|nr:heme exporter protein CcmD [Hyphomonadaceae bacterium]
MFDYGRYTPYVLWCYGIAIVVLGCLIAWTIWRVGHARRKLERAEGASPDTEKKP